MYIKDDVPCRVTTQGFQESLQGGKDDYVAFINTCGDKVATIMRNYDGVIGGGRGIENKKK